MWRYVVGAVAALLLAGAGLVLFNGRARPPSPLLPPPARTAGQALSGGLPDAVPEASARTREQKRFDRYDKDRDGAITRDEYLAARRKAYARLDANHDGVLSFDEWAVRTTTRFADADRDKSGAMSAAEFATTAPKRTAKRTPQCPPASSPRDDDA